jgi:hypothetical protein
VFEIDRSPSEQILDRNIADLPRQTVGVDKLGKTGNRLIGNSGGGTPLEDLFHLRSCHGGDGNQYELRLVFLHQSIQIRAAAQNFDTMEDEAGFMGIVIDEAANVVIQRRILTKVAQQRSAGIPGSIYDGAPAV